MVLQYIPGIIKIVSRRPRMMSIAAFNLWGQLVQPYMKRRKDGRNAWPEQISLVVTDNCNFRCHMCQFAYSDSPGYRLEKVGHMQPRIFYKLMDEMPNWPYVSFTGGEPLLNPHIIDYVAYAHDKGHLTTLTTNGWLLAKHAHALCNTGLDLLVVSVDGPPEIHDRIRGERAFEHLTAGLGVTLRLPKRPLVFLNMAISDYNFDQLVAMYDFALQMGVDGINFNHLWMQTHAVVEAFNARFASIFDADEVAWDVHPEAVDVKLVADALAEIEHRTWRDRLILTEAPFLSRAEIETWYKQPSQLVKWKTTRCAWYRIRIWPDGSVKACRDWTVGNIAHEHVEDIWNGSRLCSFRCLLAEHGTLPICARCCLMPVR
jgi:Fe-coproporphyrin III synthase